MLYRRAKIALIRMRRGQLTLDQRQAIYTAACTAAARVAEGEQVTTLKLAIETQPVGMPRQLGFERGTCTVSVNVQLSLEGKIDKIPD